MIGKKQMCYYYLFIIMVLAIDPDKKSISKNPWKTKKSTNFFQKFRTVIIVPTTASHVSTTTTM